MTETVKSLIITSKTFSLKAQTWIHDQNQALLFDVHKAGVFSKDTLLKNVRDNSVSTLSDKRWKPDAPWMIDSSLGQFAIKRNIRAITRHYWIEGGSFDGATVQADSPDYGYRIALGERVVAVNREKRLSLKSEQHIELVENTPDALLLAAIVGVIVSREKQEQRNGQGQR